MIVCDSKDMSAKRQVVEGVLSQIILPVVEYLEVFQRSIGEASDIVQKENCITFFYPDIQAKTISFNHFFCWFWA